MPSRSKNGIRRIAPEIGIIDGPSHDLPSRCAVGGLAEGLEPRPMTSAISTMVLVHTELAIERRSRHVQGMSGAPLVAAEAFEDVADVARLDFGQRQDLVVCRPRGGNRGPRSLAWARR